MRDRINQPALWVLLIALSALLCIVNAKGADVPARLSEISGQSPAL